MSLQATSHGLEKAADSWPGGEDASIEWDDTNCRHAAYAVGTSFSECGREPTGLQIAAESVAEENEVGCCGYTAARAHAVWSMLCCLALHTSTHSGLPRCRWESVMLLSAAAA